MKCVVLCWHRVLPDGVGGFIGECHRVRGTVVSLPTFQRQIVDVTRHYTPVALGDFVAALEGRAALPPRACLITFDDGYRDFADYALPVLERWSIRCALFVTAEQARKPQPLAPPDAWYATLAAARIPIEKARLWILGPSGREHHYAQPELQPALRERLSHAVGAGPLESDTTAKLYLSESQLSRLAERGVTLGGHGASHHALTTLPDDALVTNLHACCAWLDRVAPGQPATFAYPYGKVDERVARATAASGFRAGFTVRPCDGDVDAGQPLLLKRSCVPDRPTAIEELVAGVPLSI